MGMSMRYQVYQYDKLVNGEKRKEKVLVGYPTDCDISQAFHDMGLQYCLSAEGLDPYFQGITLVQLLKNLTPELMEPYGIQIYWLSREVIQIDEEQPLIHRYELESHRRAQIKEWERIRQLRDIAKFYIRKLEKLKAAQHPVVSTWDTELLAENAVAWASHFILSDAKNKIVFFEQKLQNANPSTAKTPEPLTEVSSITPKEKESSQAG